MRLTIPLVAAFLPALIAFTAIGSVTAGLLPLLFPALPRVHGPDAVRNADRVADVATFVLWLTAFVLSTRRSACWVAAWPLAVVLVWVATPFRAMTVMLAGRLRPSSGLPDALPEILREGLDTFRAAFREAPQSTWPWLGAIAIALLWLAIRRWAPVRR